MNKEERLKTLLENAVILLLGDIAPETEVVKIIFDEVGLTDEEIIDYGLEKYLNEEENSINE